MTLLEPNILPFFFGPHFDVQVAMDATEHYEDIDRLKDSVRHSIERGLVHVGIQVIAYENIDTGASIVALRAKPNAPSMVSFFAESTHRVFGGHTLACVPLQFCSPLYKGNGNYVVYRHTFKRPKLSGSEYAKVMVSGSDEEKMRAFLDAKSRDGYETIPGMSYVGISRRPWQERYVEHTESALDKNSTTRFHDAIRQMQGQQVVHVHDISAFGLSEADSKSYESELIKKSTLWPNGLNMKA